MGLFGIRKGLKSLLGVKKPKPQVKKKELPQFELVVSNGEGRELSYSQDVGMTLLMASGNLEVPIATGCSDASCGTCRIEVLEGAACLSQKVKAESDTLKANGHSIEMRLSCTAMGVRPGTVKVRAYEFQE